MINSHIECNTNRTLIPSIVESLQTQLNQGGCPGKDFRAGILGAQGSHVLFLELFSRVLKGVVSPRPLRTGSGQSGAEGWVTGSTTVDQIWVGMTNSTIPSQSL